MKPDLKVIAKTRSRSQSLSIQASLCLHISYVMEIKADRYFLSPACFDILSSGAITNLTKKEAEKLWSSDDNPWSPDFLAFFITLLMMMIFFKGVKKSVMFNHIMNAINLLGCIGLYLL